MADHKNPSPASSNYKENVADTRIEYADASNTDPNSSGLYDPDAGLSAEERAKNERKLLWKLDLKLIPWLCLLYLISFLDRTNIGNAKLDGLDTVINLGGQYNASLSIFFVSYALAEPLTNVLLKRFRPSIFLPCTMIFWGIVMTVMGLVHNFGGLMACRFFLGLAEAGRLCTGPR